MKAKLLLPYRRLVVGAAIAASVGLVLAACGAPAVAAGPASASPTHAGHMGGMTTNAKPVPGGGVPVASSSVQIINFGFSPAVITVRAGTSVTWTNKDSVAHTVYAPPSGLQSEPLDTNETYRHTFAKPGTYHYICSIHPFMHGTVMVTSQ